MAELETVTLEGVEILEADVRIFGKGSPPEGDLWTSDDLRAMAAAAGELEAAGEWRIAAKVGSEPLGRSKLGHENEQILLNSGELPAAGWLTNQRVSDDGKKLLADVTDVPRKIGELIKAKAYRVRSAELGTVKSQKTGKTYDWVVSGLAWLGGKMPAVRTLDDVVALYEEGELTVVRLYSAGDVVWSPSDSAEALKGAIMDALNPGPTPYRYWVRDIAGDHALVSSYDDPMVDGEAWIVQFNRADDGSVTVADRSMWIAAEQAWVQAARDFEQRVTVRNRRADIRRDMPETTKSYTDDQRRKFAEATGMELDKVTDEVLETAGVPVEETEPKKDLEADERFRSLEQTAKEADERSRKLETELHAERRRNFVEGLVKDCKIEPGDTEKWEKRYDADPDAARSYAADLKVDEDLLRELGSDEENLDDEALEAQNKSYEDDAATRLGIDREAII